MGKNGMSLNQNVALIMAEQVGSSGTAAFFAERGQNGDVAQAIGLLEGR